MLYMFARMSSVLLESRVTGNVPLTQYPKYCTLIWTMPPTLVQFAHPFELETCTCESLYTKAPAIASVRLQFLTLRFSEQLVKETDVESLVSEPTVSLP